LPPRGLVEGARREATGRAKRGALEVGMHPCTPRQAAYRARCARGSTLRHRGRRSDGATSDLRPACRRERYGALRLPGRVWRCGGWRRSRSWPRMWTFAARRRGVRARERRPACQGSAGRRVAPDGSSAAVESRRTRVSRAGSAGPWTSVGALLFTPSNPIHAADATLTAPACDDRLAVLDVRAGREGDERTRT
jgi:hypothetical protein